VVMDIQASRRSSAAQPRGRSSRVCVHLGTRSGMGLKETDVVVDRQYRVSMEGFYRATEGIGVVVPED
jgi:hypothetical protein